MILNFLQMKRIIIQIILIATAIYLVYEVYNTVDTPLEFEKQKEALYDEVITNLKQIRKAEIAYKNRYNKYIGNWDTLIAFVKTDSLPLVRKIGSLSDSLLEAGWTEEKALKKGLIIRDTVFVSVLEEIFGSSFDANQLKYIPNTDSEEFFLGATSVTTGSGVNVQVFEARAHNNQILSGLIPDYSQEVINLNEKRRINGKYPGLKVGSLVEANNNAGNWE